MTETLTKMVVWFKEKKRVILSFNQRKGIEAYIVYRHGLIDDILTTSDNNAAGTAV